MICSIDDCTAKIKYKKLALCVKHYTRLSRYGDTSTVHKSIPPTPAGLYGIEARNWRSTNEIGYRAAHRRISVAKGRADALTCVDCSGKASDWSYDHSDPEEKCSENGLRYSPNPDYYVARCRPCHKKFDKR